MKNAGRALVESFLLHGFLIGAIVVMVEVSAPPPKIVRLDFNFNVLEQTAAPVLPAAEATAPIPPIIQATPVPRPQPRVAAKVPSKKSIPNPATITPKAVAVASLPSEAPSTHTDGSVTADAPTGRSPNVPATRNPAASAGEEYSRANFSAIRDSILASLRYPMIARRQGWSGQVEVAFLIGLDGNVSEVRIRTSSGHEVLDEQALAAVRRAAHFIPPRRAALLVMPITFRLN